MERRFFLAICLAILVLYAYQVFLLPPPPVPDAGAPAQPAGSAPQTAGTPAAVPPAAGGQAAPTEAAPAPPGEEPAVVTAAAAEEQVVVDTGKAEIVLTNRGGRVLHWRLTDYLDDHARPLDLVPSDVPAELPRPFSLQTDDARLTARLNTALYRIADGARRIDARQEPATVVFEYEDAAGLRARKEFRFAPGTYEVAFSSDVTSGSERLNPAVAWGPGLSDLGAARAGGSFFTGNYVQPPSAIMHVGGDTERVAADGLKETPVYQGRFLFAGVDDHYFLAAAVDPGEARLEFRPIDLPGTGDTTRQLISHTIRLSSPGTLRYFVGPKQLETLQAVGIDGQLARAINYGMFTLLVVPLLSSLKWIYGFVGNYGWAIIILTIVINLVMFPLRHKSLVSMRKIQAIQPQIKAIQERYADLKITDPARQKMNTEIMNLYREKGASPAAGCVPMLLTMPVLLAFYWMLSLSIELRGADFGLWIHDLAAKDPFYVTPLLMGVTMVWQMWMSPTTADPVQQRMMMFMPIVFTVMFLQFPSGLAIYYLVSNLCQIGQQYVTNRTIGPPVPAGAAVRHDRPAKPGGGGRR